MIGYHYTSKENWEKIKKSGYLKPKLILKSGYSVPDNVADLEKYFNEVKGIWVWKDMMLGISHTMSLMYQVASKDSFNIVKLEINFPNDEYWLSFENRRVELIHRYDMGNLHRYHGSAFIWTRQIPVEWVTEVKEYDMEKLLR